MKRLVKNGVDFVVAGAAFVLSAAGALVALVLLVAFYAILWRLVALTWTTVTGWL